ncbi:STAS domain-containing protein [Nonomuraea jiangxiensis]|uniref:Anti-sigma factor antagonist n=1 Tax=Nonomuraea jiangxiensis TaxID=633440 RepID=A0A1G8TMZ1_9ACTN|nr:STAS domain-containing protein [Nonomuraea jiangxiensis]SDJ42911.1 anti-sigma B factor antagonist [Nonomuraea jiangxiensis]
MAGLILNNRPLPGGVLIVVSGEVDATNAGQLETYIIDHCRPGEHVVLDLSAMTFMDSHGLLALLHTHDFTHRHGADLHLAAVHPMPLRVLELAGIHWALNIHPDVRQASAAISASRHHGPSRRGRCEPDRQPGSG